MEKWKMYILWMLASAVCMFLVPYAGGGFMLSVALSAGMFFTALAAFRVGWAYRKRQFFMAVVMMVFAFLFMAGSVGMLVG